LILLSTRDEAFLAANSTLKVEMTFDTEQMLVNNFVDLLESRSTPFGDVSFACEFDYSRGRTDVVALRDGGHVIAFEAKLRDWRTALHQAYRNTCFAHQSFVLLPKVAALNALNCRAEFEMRRVGLCCLDGAHLVVLHDSPSTPPIEPWLASEVILQVNQHV
jgi:hypothetical protein